MYKLYRTKKKIPWITPNMSNVPNPNITDAYFNFELVERNNISFKTWDKGSIVSEDYYTYYKLENTTTGEITYWYVEGINKILSTGYELSLAIDIYMTHTRRIINSIGNNNPLVDRIFFNKRMFKTKPNLRKLIYYSFKLEDEVFDNPEFSPKELKLEETNLFKTTFPWDAKFTPSISYLHSAPGPETAFVEDGTISIDSSDKPDSKEFTQQYGYYVIMLRSKEGLFDIYPISNKVLTIRPIIPPSHHGPSFSRGQCYNKYFDLMVNIVNRKPPQSLDGVNSPIDTKTGLGFWGIKDIETIYQANSFQGIFKGPHFFTDKTKQKWLNRGWVRGTDHAPIFHYYLEHNPQDPFLVELPKSLILKDTMIDTYIEFNQPYFWGKKEIYPRKYLSYYEDNNPNNTMDDSNLVKPKFKISFLGEFIAVPAPNGFIEESDMISFGGQMISASNEYMDQVRKIQQTYDTGLTNAKIGLGQGIPSSIGKAAANPLWGISSLVGSSLTFARDYINLQMNKRNATANIGATYINSTTSDWYYFNYITGLFTKTSIASDYNPNGRPNWINLIEPSVTKIFTEEQKDQMRFILRNFGFKLNMCINYQEWFNTLENNDVAFIKFNETWINNMLPSINNQTIPLEIQQAIADQLSNGIRLNMEWR